MCHGNLWFAGASVKVCDARSFRVGRLCHRGSGIAVFWFLCSSCGRRRRAPLGFRTRTLFNKDELRAIIVFAVARRVPIEAIFVDASKPVVLPFLAQVVLPPTARRCSPSQLLPHARIGPPLVVVALTRRKHNDRQDVCNAVLDLGWFRGWSFEQQATAKTSRFFQAHTLCPLRRHTQ